MVGFHETRYGKLLFESQIPEALNALKQIAVELKRANDLKETVG